MKIFIRVLNKLGLLGFFNINVSIKLNKNKFKIPILQKIGITNLFMSEPWMIDLLKIVLSIENKTFVDVGVNIGQTLLKLKSVSSEIEYVGFEPNPLCVSYVNRLVEKNKFKNTTLLPVGISDNTEIGVLNFYTSSNTDSSASMIAKFRPEKKIGRKEFIPLYELDKVWKAIDIDVISVLKIDVEGAELEVLNSFKSVLLDKKPIILIEILPVYNRQNIFRLERQNSIQKILREAAYSIFRVIKKNDIFLYLEEVNEIGIHSDLNKCEYVMVPTSKVDKFKNNCSQKHRKQNF